MLIVLEGIDGAGTTTQAERLTNALASAGHLVHQTREPSDGPVGLLLRRMLAGEHAPVDASTLALLFAADRADHLHREVEPALARGAVVISDRWYHSSLAYQGSGEDRDWIRELNSRARRPDLTLFLRVSPEVAARRRASDRSRTTQEIFDHIETQRRVAQGYEQVVASLSPSEPIDTIDGERLPEEVAAVLLSRAQHMLSNGGAP